MNIDRYPNPKMGAIQSHGVTPNMMYSVSRQSQGKCHKVHNGYKGH
jgi:hypothetical protein